MYFNSLLQNYQPAGFWEKIPAGAGLDFGMKISVDNGLGDAIVAVLPFFNYGHTNSRHYYGL
jgi:hypothetical protein